MTLASRLVAAIFPSTDNVYEIECERVQLLTIFIFSCLLDKPITPTMVPCSLRAKSVRMHAT